MQAACIPLLITAMAWPGPGLQADVVQLVSVIASQSRCDSRLPKPLTKRAGLSPGSLPASKQLASGHL